MEVLTGFNEFLALVVIMPVLFTPFLILVSFLIRAFVWRIRF